MLAVPLLLLPVLLIGCIAYLLRPQSGATRSQVWSLTALAPMLVALCVAAYVQGQAAAALAQAGPRQTTLTIENEQAGGKRETYTLTLSAEQAACFEQTRRLTARAEWLGDAAPILLNEHTVVRGKLPDPKVAGQMNVLGRLNCRQWVQPVRGTALNN